jgi:hypothetical protein
MWTNRIGGVRGHLVLPHTEPWVLWETIGLKTETPDNTSEAPK